MIRGNHLEHYWATGFFDVELRDATREKGDGIMSTTDNTHVSRAQALTRAFAGASPRATAEEVIAWLRRNNSTADILEALANVERSVRR